MPAQLTPSPGLAQGRANFARRKNALGPDDAELRCASASLATFHLDGDSVRKNAELPKQIFDRGDNVAGTPLPCPGATIARFGKVGRKNKRPKWNAELWTGDSGGV